MANQEDAFQNTKSHRLLSIDELPSSRSVGGDSKESNGGAHGVKPQASYRVSFLQPYQQRQQLNSKSSLGFNKKRQQSNSNTVVSISEQLNKN